MVTIGEIEQTFKDIFQDEDGKVWCIDYEHATQRTSEKPHDWFLAQFLEDPDMREWNPDFA